MEEVERFVPGMEGAIWCEHWHRYHFAAALAAGRAVVDAACGEGYGSALLARHATRVTGVDASADTLALACRRYAAPNLDFRHGRCESLPLPDASADLVVSFETIEHLEQPCALIAEAARVLRVDGVFLVSTPNRALHTDATSHHNPFHRSEMYQDEFVAALRERFGAMTLFGQRVDAYSAIWPLAAAPDRASLLQARTSTATQAAAGLPDPLYFIAACAASPAALAALGAPFSLLADQDHRLGTEADGVRKELQRLQAHALRLEAAYLDANKRLAALLQEREKAWSKPR